MRYLHKIYLVFNQVFNLIALVYFKYNVDKRGSVK